MKNIIVIPVISVLLVLSEVMQAQTIMPDEIFTSTNDSALWFENGTAFCSHNGATYAFIWTREKEPGTTGQWRWYPYVYLLSNNDLHPFIVENSSKLHFGYKHEDSYGYYWDYRLKVTIVGNAFAFSYHGHMWFSCVIEHPPYPAYYPGTYYQLWARYDADSLKWDTWYYELDEKPIKYNVWACQVDSLLHLFYYDGSKNPDGSIIGLGKDIYKYDAATRNIVFKQHGNITLPGNRVGGMFTYKDTCGNTNYVYNSYIPNSMHWVTCKGPVLGTHFLASPGVGASTITQGSAKGKRPNETVHPEEAQRFNVVYIGNIKQSDKTYLMYDEEYIIPMKCSSFPYKVRTSIVTLPVTGLPETVDGYFQADLTSAMVPKDFSPQIGGMDGLWKKIQVFYPDGDEMIHGAFFKSDNWRLVPNASLYNNDLDKDSLYGPEIRKLWTLIGITDGAPPCSIDWPVWETWYYTDPPTKLAFTINNESTSEVTTTFEDSYSAGGSIAAGNDVASMNSSFEYASMYESLVSSSTTISTSISTNFGLHEDAQNFGYFIWNIPQIARTSYMVYPWYDTLCQHPIPSSLQYQFRTIGSMIKAEHIDCSRFPFLINKPNDSTLYDYGMEARLQMANEAFYNGLSPLKTLHWESPEEGQNFTFAEANKTTTSVETKNTYTWKQSFSFGCPGIFQVAGNFGEEVSYSTKNKYESQFGDEVAITLEKLNDKKYGVNFSEYNVSAYWFKPNQADWWYLDSVPGQTPWYIGYIVSSLYQRIVLLTPEPGSHLRNSDNLFTWEAEDGAITDYELFISKDPTAGPGSTVYRLACGERTVASPGDFAWEPGKTYYWLVRGKAENGEVVWSDPRAFTIGKEQPGTEDLLKASVYPNPTEGRQVSVAYDLQDEGKVSIYVYDINGHLMQKTEAGERPVGISTHMLNLTAYAPGIYLVMIQTDYATAIKKLVVNE